MLRTRLQRLTATDVVVWLIGLSILVGIIWGSIATLESHKYTTANWLDLTTTGLALGGVYALLALGYTLVYGILRMINFAHGDIFMTGAFTTVFVANGLQARGVWNSVPVLSLLFIMLVSATVAATIAVLTERVAYRPLRNAPRLVPLITAIGVSYFLEYAFRGMYGSGVEAYPTLKFLDGYWQVAGIHLYKTQAAVIVGALVLMLVLYTIVQRTKIGRAMRAVSEDREVAALMGVDVDRTILMTFAIGGASAGIAGILYILLFPVVNFYMGFFPGLKAFTAAVLGGIGNVPGAFIGGIILGLLEAVGPSLFLDGLHIPAPYQLKDAIAFIVLVLILIIRPTGILGERLTRTKA